MTLLQPVLYCVGEIPVDTVRREETSGDGVVLRRTAGDQSLYGPQCTKQRRFVACAKWTRFYGPGKR